MTIEEAIAGLQDITTFLQQLTGSDMYTKTQIEAIIKNFLNVTPATLASSNSITWDYAVSDLAYLSLAHNATLSITNAQDNQIGYLVVVNTGNFNLTLPDGSNFVVKQGAGAITQLSWIKKSGVFVWSGDIVASTNITLLGNQMSSNSGTDLTAISGYDAAQQQIIYNDNGDLKWVDKAVLAYPTLASPTLSTGTITSTSGVWSWTAPTNATGYIFETSADGSTGWTVRYTGTANTFTTTSLTPGTPLYGRVRATATGYNSSPYATANMTTLGAGEPDAGTVNILDNFADTDNTALASHTIAPTNTVAAAWTVNYGSLKIIGNKLRGVYPSGGDFVLATLDATAANGTLSAIIDYGSYNMNLGLVFRYVDIDNYFFISAGSADKLIIFEMVAGTLVNRAEVAFDFNGSIPTTVTLTLNGSSISATVTDGIGSTPATANHTSTNGQTATKHGVRMDGVTVNDGTIDAFHFSN